MVIFDQLRISDDGKSMYIDLHVNKADYFKDIYLDSIYIMTGDKAVETNTDPDLVSDANIKAYEEDNNVNNFLYVKKFDDNQKEVSLALGSADFSYNWETDASKRTFLQSDMPKTLFFVYVVCKGTPDACTPCNLSKMTTLGVTFDKKQLYQRVMDFTKPLADTCKIPVAFADFILLWNAFKAAIATGHYIPAVDYWHMLFDSYGGSNTVTKGCSCHG